MGIINFKVVAGVMLFVILLSIQFTLNKILVLLKDINKEIKLGKRNTDGVIEDEVRRY
ncbi:hypothetical protein [Peptostreptococcus equinus]|uniref:Uncharacterized protein n=1 Tax=Peptostreptococcus equinus TaxID=3003601 RepID=A0ABY7JQD0_9FIRM|nr:hypothetical protein [Peptostreptococcus sp. CBA3647]WAW15320.1 hypothetical protein O0R46_02375 [Peptostreptococcus sp. CBA3647]